MTRFRDQPSEWTRSDWWWTAGLTVETAAIVAAYLWWLS